MDNSDIDNALTPNTPSKTSCPEPQNTLDTLDQEEAGLLRFVTAVEEMLLDILMDEEYQEAVRDSWYWR